MPLQVFSKNDVLDSLHLIKTTLSARDKVVFDGLAQSEVAKSTSVQEIADSLDHQVDLAIAFVTSEDHQIGETFHSRNRLAGLAQSHFSAGPIEVTHNDVGDALPAAIQAFGEGDAAVWAPVIVNILIEHLRPKAEFRAASDQNSYIEIPTKCTIALLGDWGADNDHAQRIAQQVQNKNPDFAIHLGDIYYAGGHTECERFLANWPIQDPKKSFALNGNHEMYSRGIPYFEVVLKAFQQEASYFSLYNEHWQLHGLDTAYVPFSIDGSVPIPEKSGFLRTVLGSLRHLIPALGHETFDLQPDERLKTQWKWLVDKVTANPQRKNIFLSHNQPVSAYLPEFQAGAFLHDQARRFQEAIPAGANAIYAWFFGHEHKCTIYADDQTDFRARLVGNGSIPHSRQALVAAQRDETKTSCTPVFTMNDRIVKHDALGLANLDLAISGFALLTLDGPNASAEYINEDGSLFLKENLTGKPNEVLEWGAGYGPLATPRA